MANDDIMTTLFELEQTMAHLLQETQTMQNQISALMRENKNLKSKNEKLQQLLIDSKETTGHQPTTSPGPSASTQMITQLYQQGFHICNEEYGKRMGEGEHCLFCEAMIDRLLEGSDSHAKR